MPRKKAAPTATGDLTFLVSTNVGKPDPNTRKFIRSHVMVGKNAGRKLPPRKGKDSPDEASPTQIESTQPEALPICRRFTSSRSAFVLADTVEPGELGAVLELSSIAKKLLFALEPVIFFERRNEDWIIPLTTDAAYLHCQIFSAQVFLGNIQRANTGLEMSMTRQTSSHYIKALQFLSMRLTHEDEHVRLSNSTLATMCSFARHAALSGDYATAKRHVYGMCRIIQARGGTETFSGGSEKLLVEILRRDLGLSLAQESKPIFTTIFPIEEPLLRYPDLTSLLKPQSLTPNRTSPANINEYLTQAWDTMADFSKLINFAAATQQRITTATFLRTMAAVMYRLLLMSPLRSPRDEAIRLSLLAFSSSAFLSWHSLGTSSEYLKSAFKENFPSFMNMKRTPRLDLWMMMIAAISLLDESDDSWLRPSFELTMQACGVEKWEDVKDLMHEFLWIDMIHDKPSRVLFNRLMRSNA